MRKEVKAYIDLADERMQKAVHALFAANLEEDAPKPIGDDWWDEISDGERANIEEGLAQSARGEGISHDEMIKRYPEWLK